ncbi:MAG: DUF4166 domain-containing protein [Pseudomonadota bacterium]
MADITVLILGGYGVFGGRLARLLLEDGARVLVAGRSRSRAQNFCRTHGGTPLITCREDLTAALLHEHGVQVLIDAAGPFQAYDTDPYRLADAAIEAGCAYLDLSDDAGFTAQIAGLDPAAQAAHVPVISGVSTVPALSAAAVATLGQGLEQIGLIDTAILPGNRAPRGLSVMRAILGQAGRPLRLWRGGRWREVPGWSSPRRIALPGAGSRWASFIGAPDLALFPEHFGARSVLFRAGLELRLLHFGLWFMSIPVRWGVIRSLAPAARPMRWLARCFEPFGTDRGGMRVSVAGRDAAGKPSLRTWSLIAEEGDGPFIPAIAANLLVKRIAQGTLAPGARAALADLSLSEVEDGLARLRVTCSREAEPAPRLFEDALGPKWAELPTPIRRLHDIWDVERFSGQAQITGAENPFARLIAAFFRFPRSMAECQVTVTKTRRPGAETWRRDFGGPPMVSHLRALGPGLLEERFGPMRFRLQVDASTSGLSLTILSGTCLGLPIPAALLPRTTARESVVDGCFRFDVALHAPIVGLLAHYRGWLKPEADEP